MYIIKLFSKQEFFFFTFLCTFIIVTFNMELTLDSLRNTNSEANTLFRKRLSVCMNVHCKKIKSIVNVI